LVVLPGLSGPVLSAAFSPNGRLIVTSSCDDTASVYALPGMRRNEGPGGSRARATRSRTTPRTHVTNQLFVAVEDERLGESFELEVEEAAALDAFRHPYAYTGIRDFALAG
jgi:hypothetical protein